MNFPLITLKEAGIVSEIPETQETIEGNARQKALFIFEMTGMDCFADDTGLEIAALYGAPGVYSARYAGEGCSFSDNVRKVLEELTGIENRQACFRTVICLVMNGETHLFEGRIDGTITNKPRGEDGFGYDPVFLPEGEEMTFAEMSSSLKNKISHRGRAVHEMLRFLDTLSI